MQALIIGTPHIDRILAGKECWEIRGSRTKGRGTIALIRSKSGTIIGVCDLLDCIGPLTSAQFRKNARKARLQKKVAALGHRRNTFAWVLKNAHALKNPVPYDHLSGAVIWFNLDTKTTKAVRGNLRAKLL